jgi:uncharacterized protein
MDQMPLRRIRTAVLLLLICAAMAACDRKIPREGPVTDRANVLAPQDRERLDRMIEAYRRETAHEIAVLIVPTLEGEGIGSLTLRVANAWRLGVSGHNNGIVVAVAVEERQVRIEPGRGFRRVISTLDAEEIVRTHMTPAFRDGDYAGGLERGLKALMIMARRYVISPETEKQW